MKKEKINREPLCRRWSGIVSGSPSHSERPKTRARKSARKASVTSARADRVDDEPARAGEQESEEGRVAPLRRGDPGVARREHRRHDAEVRRVEDVLASPAQQELARDGGGGGERGEQRGVGAQQQAQRQPRDQRAARVERREAGDPRAGELRRERRGEQQGDACQRDVQPQRCEAVEQKPGQRADLVEARIPEDRSRPSGESFGASAHATERHRRGRAVPSAGGLQFPSTGK